jgi:MFS family permease
LCAFVRPEGRNGGRGLRTFDKASQTDTVAPSLGFAGRVAVLGNPRFGHWATFVSLSLLFFLVNAGTFASLGVVLPAMVREMHWTWVQAGMGYTVLGLSCGLSSLVPTFLIRRIGVRSPLIIGSAMLVAGFGLLAGGHSVGTYLFATLLNGLGNTLTATIPGTHVLTNLFKRKSAILGAYFTAGALGGVAGPLLFVAVNTVSHGWRGYWVIFSGGALLFGLLAILTTPNRLGHTVEAAAPERLGASEIIEGLQQWTVKRALASAQYYIIVSSYMLYLLVNTTMHNFAVEHLSERGIDPKAAAGMLSLEALIGAGVSMIGGALADKVGAKRLLITALASLGIGTAALAEAHGYGLMLVYALGMGIAFGLIFVAPTLLLLDYFGRKPNLELYSLMGLFSVIAAVGPTLAGWARDLTGDFDGMFLLCAAATLVMLAAVMVMRPPSVRAGPEGPTEALAREAA